MSDGKYKVFVGNLPPDLTEEELRMVFNTYGNTTDCHIMAGKASSGQSCAFVVYDSADGASTAIATLNNVYSFRDDGSPPIHVSWAKQSGGGGGGGGGGCGSRGGSFGHQTYSGGCAGGCAGGGAGGGAGGCGVGYGGHHAVAPPSGGYGGKGSYGGSYAAAASPPPVQQFGGQRTKLFVGNLPADIQQEALRMVFSHYGTVTNVHIMAGKSKSGQSCAFVEYASTVEAETAILTLHEKYEIRPGEGNIIVKYASAGGGGPRPSPY